MSLPDGEATASESAVWIAGAFCSSTASGVALAGIHVRDAKAATENDLAYANFGLATSYLVADFYSRSLEAAKLEASTRPALRRGRAAATLHARELTALLTGAGDTPATAEDFTFEWPVPTFATAASIRRTGTAVLRASLGAYQQAAATLTEPTYRVLFASLSASVAQQVGTFTTAGAPAEPFPLALDLETASAALEAFLG